MGWFKDKVTGRIVGKAKDIHQKHFQSHKDEMGRLQGEMEQAATEQERETLQQQYRQRRNRLYRNYALAGGATVGAAGLYMAGKGAAKAGKGVARALPGAYANIRDNHMYDLFLFITAALYFTATTWFGSLQMRLAVDVVLMFAIWFLVLDEEQKNRETLIVMVMIGFAEVVLPHLIYQVNFLITNKFVYYYVANPQVTAPWFYFLVIKSGGRTFISKWVRILVIMYIVAILISTIATTLSFEDISTYITPQQTGAAGKLISHQYEWWKDVFTHFGQVVKQGKQYFINRMNYATGDMYTGTVDENQYETLGVFLKNLKPSDPEFYVGDTVTVWALLEAKTLEDGLSINVSCYHGKKNEDGSFPADHRGETYPYSGELPTIYDEESLDIDCRFPNSAAGTMNEGSNKVTVQADFHFETMAYQKAYFMNQDTLRSMQRQGLDPLDEYGIEDKEPVARYTNGPVKIGMSSGEQQPIGISSLDPTNPRLGITIMSNDAWEGKIKELKELLVMVPDTMSLDTGFCPEFKEIDNYEKSCVANYEAYRSKQLMDCVTQAGLDKESDIDQNGKVIGTAEEQEAVTSCMENYCKQELEGYKVYNLTINDDNRLSYSNFGQDVSSRQYKTLSCRVKLDRPEDILGNVPISTQYFRVKARYIYEIEESVNVNLKEPPEGVSKYNRPRPPSSTDVANQVSYIYGEYYAKDPYSIKKWCTDGSSSQILGDSKKCACMLMAIMARESNGDVNVKDADGGKSRFLMQIQDTTAKSVWDAFKLDTCDLHTIDCNIMTAAYYLKQIENTGKTESKPENYAAAYNCGEKALLPTTDCDGKLNWACPFSRNNNDNKCTYNNQDTTREVYVPYVMQRYDTCMEMDLMDKSVIKEPTPAQDIAQSGTLTLALPNETGTVKQDVEGTPYTIKVNKNGDDYYVQVYYGANNAEYKSMLAYVTLIAGQEQQLRAFPMMKVELSSDKSKLDYSYMKQASSATVTLIKDKRKMSGSDQVMDDSTVFEGWLSAWYHDDEITLYDHNSNAFCTVPWSSYTDRQTGTCQEDNFFMLKVVNQETFDSDNSLLDSVTGTGASDKAAVQVQFDPNYNHDCCGDCTTCNKLSEKQLYCNSCKNCDTEAVDVYHTSFICSVKQSASSQTGSTSGTSSTSSQSSTASESPLETPPAEPSCCQDCYQCSIDDCRVCENLGLCREISTTPTNPTDACVPD